MSWAPRTVADLAAAYRAGRTTPRAVAERALAAVAENDRRDPPLRSFIALDAADVRAQADAAAARHKSGRTIGPLDGVPVAVKDEFDVRGYGTTVGTSFLGKRPASADALAVARLRAAGAVIFGKTNMHEFGVFPSGFNVNHGAARNPYDPSRDTGGSSSGSGAAVASGVVPLALGLDGGGSVRIPAGVCGVAGIKGTFGRFPLDGVPVLCWSLEHGGPLGSTVADVLAGFVAATGADVTLPAVEPARLKLGVCRAWWDLYADDEVARVVRSAVERAGFAPVPIELPNIAYAQAVGVATFAVEAAVSTEPHVLANQPMAASTRMMFESGRGVNATSFVKAQRVRALVYRDFERALAGVDALVTPTTGITGPPYRADTHSDGEVDEEKATRMTGFTFPLNLTGLPAASVPCGYSNEGMPIGLQVITGHGADAQALAIAAAVERTVERRRPQIWVDLLRD
jgi:Asp-tRNA(Asn)/Glu-tRNA(Gln) amidotransferase A subunit family amidase